MTNNTWRKKMVEGDNSRTWLHAMLANCFSSCSGDSFDVWIQPERPRSRQMAWDAPKIAWSLSIQARTFRKPHPSVFSRTSNPCLEYLFSAAPWWIMTNLLPLFSSNVPPGCVWWLLIVISLHWCLNHLSFKHLVPIMPKWGRYASGSKSWDLVD